MRVSSKQLRAIADYLDDGGKSIPHVVRVEVDREGNPPHVDCLKFTNAGKEHKVRRDGTIVKQDWVKVNES